MHPSFTCRQFQTLMGNFFQRVVDEGAKIKLTVFEMDKLSYKPKELFDCEIEADLKMGFVSPIFCR